MLKLADDGFRSSYESICSSFFSSEKNDDMIVGNYK